MKLIYEDIALGADKDAAYTGEASNFSDITQLSDGIPVADAWTLEPNQFGLDGTFHPVPQQAFWSNQVSGADGNFAAPPTITINFDGQYTSLGITLIFGEYEWCSNLNIKWYRGSELLANANFQPDYKQYFCEQTVQAYNRIVITLLKTNFPHRYARLSKIVFGITRTFEDDEIREGIALLEISPTSEDLSTNTLNVTLDSLSPINYIFQKKQTFTCYDHDRLIGVFYIDGSRRFSPTVYDVECVDAIGCLQDVEFNGEYYQNKNAYELLVELAAPFEIDMDEALKEKVVNGIIEPCTRREAIQQVCFAILAVADTSGTDKIRIFQPSYEPEKVDPYRVFLGGSVSKDDIVTSVSLAYWSFQTSEPGNDVDSSTFKADGKKYYGIRNVKTKNNPLIVSTDVQKEILIDTATLISSSNVDEVLSNLYDYYLKRVTHLFDAAIFKEFPGDSVTVPYFAGQQTGIIDKMKITMSGLTVCNYRTVGGE